MKDNILFWLVICILFPPLLLIFIIMLLLENRTKHRDPDVLIVRHK